VWLSFALTAAVLTSFLPIINKRLLVDTPVPVVAWGVNALSLPILGGRPLALSLIPPVDALFWLALIGLGALNWAATLMSTQALKLGDASFVTPLLTFNPAFTLLVGLLTLGETPTLLGTVGVVVVLAGAYLLSVEGAAFSWWRPFVVLVTRPAMLLALAASFAWALTPIAEKVAIQHSSPPDSTLVAFGSTALMTLFLTPLALRLPRPVHWLASQRRGFLTAAIIAGIAPIFGFAAIATGLVGYVTAIFKLSTVLTLVWAALLLRERVSPPRLLGAAVMTLGALMIGF